MSKTLLSSYKLMAYINPSYNFFGNLGIYKERHLVENFFQFIKRYRRIATRYEMLAQNYIGMVTIGCIL